MTRGKPERFHVEGGRGMDGKQRAKRGGQKLFRFRVGQWMYKASQRHIEKFLNDLVADDSVSGSDCLANELSGACRFFRGILVEGVYKDVGVQKKPNAHSSRPV
jgi:hypothetical protein